MPTRPRVLIADDHPGIVNAFGRLLSAECDVVGVIVDGREVADAAARLQPVVLVVDLNLPNVNGLEVCRQIAQTSPGVKVIVVSAFGDEYIKEQVIAAGASGFLEKSAASELPLAIRRIWAEST